VVDVADQEHRVEGTIDEVDRQVALARRAQVYLEHSLVKTEKMAEFEKAEFIRESA
jgi:hypothetical protein